MKRVEEMTNFAVYVSERREEAPDIVSLKLLRADGEKLPPFSAGAHVDVYLPTGHVRQYSLCNGPGDNDHYEIAVLRALTSRGGSSYINDKVRVGDQLMISEPRNTFPLKHRDRTILVAGGIGITPLLSMAKHLAGSGSDFTLHYCARSAAKAAFCAELRETSFARHVRFHFDDGGPEQRFDLEKALGPPERGMDIYLCGPTGFIDFVQGGAIRAGFRSGQIHVEHFSPQLPNSADDHPFTIEIGSTGKKVFVAADQTAVQALAAAGIEIVTSCEQGFCGTCVTRVLDGLCDHRDICLSAEERENAFTPCCSRAITPLLVLDL